MKHLFLLALLPLLAGFSAFSQKTADLANTGIGINLIESTSSSLVFSNYIDAVPFREVKTKDGVYTRLNLAGYTPAGNLGCPELPSINKLIEVPTGAKIKIRIISYEEQVIDLNTLGMSFPIMPEQPSLFKNQDPASVEFVKKTEYYDGSTSFEPEFVKVVPISKMRGVQIARLSINPFTYDAASNTMTIKNNLVAEVTFEDADISSYNETKSKYYSPAFGMAYSKIWNFSAPATKDALSTYPVKYVIVSAPMFEETLQPFIEWKTKKGFNVIEAYTNNPSVGTTQASIKNYLKGLYDAATTEDPAPTYVLFVGDVAQIPTTNTGQHHTDMYTVEFDGGGDYVPEIYFGRFSATSVAQLQPQIEKTLMYEEYTFPDPSFLEEVVLIAGADNTYGPTHANGQINYANQNYFNITHDITPYVYLYPASATSESAIIANLSAGVALVNYTAHCGSDGWGDPSFTTSQIPSLENEDEYFFSIGNCCLSSKFDESECFGEALLRTSKKGAVAHIGGTNSTLWNEDFYWSVGVTATINANPTYAGTTQAAYDHLFHENGEDPYVSAYQMAYIGNMAVMESSSSEDKYYWEIYCVLGDPSLMPYAGIPDALVANYMPSVSIGTGQLLVETEPGAYVAISIDGVLLDAKLADANGEALLEFAALESVATADIVATKQFRQPYIGTCTVIPNGNDYDAMLKTIIKPESMMNIAEASFQPTFEIMNLGQETLTSAIVSYQIDGQNPVETTWNGSVEFMGTANVVFGEISMTQGNHTITATVSSPNGETDQYPANNSKSKDVLVYSGDVSLLSIEAPIDLYCNQTMFEPQIIVKNLDATPLTSLTCGFTVNTTEYEFVWTGNLAQNQTTTITFPNWWFSPGVYSIDFYIANPNGGSDLDEEDNTASKSFRINSPGQLVRFTLLTDNYGSETTWQLVDDQSSDVVYSGGPYEDDLAQTLIYDWCLANGCYTFTIFDSYGDGMSGSWWAQIPPGNVNITNSETEEVYLEVAGDNFQTSKVANFCISINVGVDNKQTEGISIYPNPANDILNINSDETIQKLFVYNSLGQIISEVTPASTLVAIETASLAEGVYIIRIETKTGSTIHRVSIAR